MTSSPDDPLLPPPAKYGLALVFSLGWLVPLWIAHSFSAEADRQAAGAGPVGSFPYESAAADLYRLTWRWLMVLVVFWGVVGVVVWWRRVRGRGSTFCCS